MSSLEVVVMFQIGAMAVYPAHGVGVIESIQEREVAGFLQSFYIMRLLDTDMIIMIPTKNARQHRAAVP